MPLGNINLNEPKRSAWRHVWGEKPEDHMVHIGYLSSIVFALLMVGSLWVRPFLNLLFSSVSPDEATRQLVISCMILGSGWVIASFYKDIQAAQVLARQVTNVAQDEADFWLSLLPVVAMVAILAMWVVGRVHVGAAEWLVLWMFTKEAIADLVFEFWTSRRLTLRTVGVDPLAGRTV